ncbi:MAG: site-specific DNA-methyltransferase, partial [Hyphomicrobium sp.]
QKSKRAEPRVPFGTIVELGILKPGAMLLDARARIRAEVKADGTVTHGGHQGSIHRLGALVQGKSACNGWTFWHYEAEGTLKPIDSLRDEAKRQLGLVNAPMVVAAE